MTLFWNILQILFAAFTRIDDMINHMQLRLSTILYMVMRSTLQIEMLQNV